MKKRVIAWVLFLGLTLCACADGGKSDSQKENGGGTGTRENDAGFPAGNGTEAGKDSPEAGNPESAGEADAGNGLAETPQAAGNGSGGDEDGAGTGTGEAGTGSAGAEETGTEAVQGGPFGKISVTLPSGWKYETFPVDSEEMLTCRYGIHFSPRDAEEGYIEIGYVEGFGVCGTGLEETDAVIAGCPASVGTYDGHGYWNFISFREQNEHVVALSYGVEAWWDDYGSQVMEIMDTLSYEPDEKEGSAYIFQKESERSEIGLYFYLENISAQKATLCYRIFDQDARTGELSDGDSFALEQYREGKWEEVPVAVEGEYGFHDIAYVISGEEVTKRELDWKWLYGELPPGQYRIRKEIMDFRKTGDFDLYTVYAQFILN